MHTFTATMFFAALSETTWCTAERRQWRAWLHKQLVGRWMKRVAARLTSVPVLLFTPWNPSISLLPIHQQGKCPRALPPGPRCSAQAQVGLGPLRLEPQQGGVGLQVLSLNLSLPDRTGRCLRPCCLWHHGASVSQRARACRGGRVGKV